LISCIADLRNTAGDGFYEAGVFADAFWVEFAGAGDRVDGAVLSALRQRAEGLRRDEPRKQG